MGIDCTLGMDSRKQPSPKLPWQPPAGKCWYVSVPMLCTTKPDGKLAFLQVSSSLLNGNVGVLLVFFPLDCPQLQAGAGALASSRDTAFGTIITFSCPAGQEFATGTNRLTTHCLSGGNWSISYIPKCQVKSSFILNRSGKFRKSSKEDKLVLKTLYESTKDWQQSRAIETEEAEKRIWLHQWGSHCFLLHLNFKEEGIVFGTCWQKFWVLLHLRRLDATDFFTIGSL